MKIAAIIAEYNPFHLGHAWQIASIRGKFGNDTAIIAVMSGCMTQRGEPALLDKWSRTRMALACGVNLVIELPLAYAAASAERFASGGVQLIKATGLECQLVFGSESGNLDDLQRLASILAEEPPEYRKALRLGLDAGESFPAARQQAVASFSGQAGLAELLAASNNILAVEYLKALMTADCKQIRPVTFQRQGQAYNDSDLPDKSVFASASAIRKLVAGYRQAGPTIMASLVGNLADQMPTPAVAILMEKIQNGPGPLFLEDLAGPIISLLRSQPTDVLETIPGMGEGLGRRLATAARRPGFSHGQTVHSQKSGRLATLLADAATRRFPQTRLQRALLALLAGLQQKDLELFDTAGGPQYLRILGFDKNGRYLLKLMRRHATLPILMNGSDTLEYQDAAFSRMAELDILATDLWMLAAGETCGQDFDRPPVMR
jgi:predicted nucleotidyltransferase